MKRPIILALALASGLATWALLSQQTRQIEGDTTARPNVGTVEIVVYARNLQRGTFLSNDVLAWQRQLAETLAPDAIVREGEDGGFPSYLKGKLLRTDVSQGEPVRQSALVEGSASFMALAVTPGMRAVAIRVTPDKLAGGFVLPDDRVDIVHTVVRDIDGDGVSNGYSEVILKNIRILAVGLSPTRRNVFQTADEQAVTDAQRSTTTAEGDTVTLEVTDAQVKLLNSAAAVGQLSLALRAIEDHGKAQIGEAMMSTERAGAFAPPQAQPAAGTATTPGLGLDTVTLIQGGQRVDVKVPAGVPEPEANQ